MKPAGHDSLTAADDAAVIEASYGHAEHFAVVFDRHAPHIHRYLARRVGRQVADDLVAETFLTAFGKRRRYDTSHRDARPWLYGIATNLIGRHRREEIRQVHLHRAARVDPAPAGHAERVVADVTAQTTRALLADALNGLAVGDRDVLVLIACEELSYDEVARALGIPVGTVRSRLHRARTKLRHALSGAEAAATYMEILNNE